MYIKLVYDYFLISEENDHGGDIKEFLFLFKYKTLSIFFNVFLYNTFTRNSIQVLNIGVFCNNLLDYMSDYVFENNLVCNELLQYLYNLLNNYDPDLYQLNLKLSIFEKPDYFEKCSIELNKIKCKRIKIFLKSLFLFDNKQFDFFIIHSKLINSFVSLREMYLYNQCISNIKNIL